MKQTYLKLQTGRVTEPFERISKETFDLSLKEWIEGSDEDCPEDEKFEGIGEYSDDFTFQFKGMSVRFVGLEDVQMIHVNGELTDDEVKELWNVLVSESFWKDRS